MKKIITSASAAMVAAGSVHAGALDRSGQSIDVLFETGRYAEFSVGVLSPEVTGKVSNSAFGVPGTKSGDIGENTFNFGAAYKADINEKFSYAIIIDQPYRAKVDYPTSTDFPPYFGSDALAEFKSVAVTGLLQYNMTNGVSIYGGPRVQEVKAKAEIPFANDYSVDADGDWGIGYVVGAAYERPDIALRVSLTYGSKIKHKNDVTENITAIIPGFGAVPIEQDSTATFKTPQSLNLAFQTGIAADTLVFGSVRWVDWSDFDLSPDIYASPGAVGQPLLSYEDDVITYTLGVGRKLNESWSIAGSGTFEKNTGNLFTNLGPNDGQISVGLAAIYTYENMKITAGARYVWIGDTTTAIRGVEAAEFNNNNAVAFGAKIGYYF